MAMLLWDFCSTSFPECLHYRKHCGGGKVHKAQLCVCRTQSSKEVNKTLCWSSPTLHHLQGIADLISTRVLHLFFSKQTKAQRPRNGPQVRLLLSGRPRNARSEPTPVPACSEGLAVCVQRLHYRTASARALCDAKYSGSSDKNISG